MLYALADPVSFVVLALSFLLACTLVGWTQSLLTPRPLLDDARRTSPDPRRHVEPFGLVAVALTGLGWPRPVPLSRVSPGRSVLVALAGPLVALLAAAALLAGAGLTLGQVDADTSVLQSGVGGLPLSGRVLLLAGIVHLFVGLLSLVPLPPLDGGRLLFALAPRSLSWQRAEDYLVEKNLGLVAVLVLLLLPLAGREPLLPSLLSTVGRPLVRLLSGLG